MATLAQIHANRRNAQRSTGPKTEAGKQTSSRNSVKHGMLARVIPVETEGFSELLTGLYESLRPQDELQRFLVDQIAHCIVRLQRSAACEQRWLGTDRPVTLPSGFAYAGEESPAGSPAARIDEFLRAKHCQILIRYEAACNRQIQRNLDLLRKLQSAPQSAPNPDCPYLTEQEGAPPSAPLCPEAKQPCVSYARLLADEQAPQLASFDRNTTSTTNDCDFTRRAGVTSSAG
jgi:hypothetical protein